MKLIIDIPKEEYELIRHGNKSFITELTLLNAVAEGIPLPKNGGRLMIVSENKVKENLIKVDFSCQRWISEVGLSFATYKIIEVDRGE